MNRFIHTSIENFLKENNEFVTLYHGTSITSWEHTRDNNSLLYLSNDRKDAMNYAYETAANDEAKGIKPEPILCVIDLNTLENINNIDFQPDWGGYNVNNSTSWRETFEKFGSFSIWGKIDNIKPLFKITKI